VVGVFGLGEGAVLAGQRLSDGAAVAFDAAQHHRHADVAEQAKAVGQPGVHAVELVANVLAGQRAAGGGFPEMREQR